MNSGAKVRNCSRTHKHFSLLLSLLLVSLIYLYSTSPYKAPYPIYTHIDATRATGATHATLGEVAHKSQPHSRKSQRRFPKSRCPFLKSRRLFSPRHLPLDLSICLILTFLYVSLVFSLCFISLFPYANKWVLLCSPLGSTSSTIFW